jgi:hypothetical protein
MSGFTLVLLLITLAGLIGLAYGVARIINQSRKFLAEWRKGKPPIDISVNVRLGRGQLQPAKPKGRSKERGRP